MITAHVLLIRATIGAKMAPRTGKQCRERYLNHLSPNIKHGQWSREEDAIMCKLHLEYGNKWVQYRVHLPGDWPLQYSMDAVHEYMWFKSYYMLW